MRPRPQRTVSAETLTAFGAQPREHRLLVVARRAERHVPALAGDDLPAVSGRHEGRNTQPGAGAEHDLGAAPLFAVPAERPRVGRRQPEQGPGQGFEIVDRAHLRKAEAVAQLGQPETPRPVGQRDLVAVDRAGNGENRGRRHFGDLPEILIDRRLEAVERIVGEGDDVARAQTAFGEGESARGAADIGDQAQEPPHRV